MSQCIDRRFEPMLYAFELGVLDENDRRALEIHLLECEHCFDRALSFEKAARLLVHDPEIRESALLEYYGEDKHPAKSPNVWNRFAGFRLAFVSAIAVMVFLALLLKPWKMEFSTDLEAVAAKPSLAVMYFDNMTAAGDPERIGDVATNLLITDISESGYFQVVSYQRLYDILKNMGLTGIKKIDDKTAHRVARQSRASRMITGAILQTEPNLIISAQLVDVEKGNIIASEKVAGGDGESIFPVIDRLAVKLRADLNLPPGVLAKPHRQVAELTTNSTEAYQYYMEGLENESKLFKVDAYNSFKKAVEYDSSFAMAYYHLTRHVSPEARQEYIEKAMQYSGNLGDRERRLILASYLEILGQTQKSMEQLYLLIASYPDDKESLSHLAAMEYHLGMFEMSIRHCDQALELDPLYGQSYNMKAYSLASLGKQKESIDNINRYIDISPDEPNPYDSRGDLYVQFGMIDSAVYSLQKALEIKPDFPSAQFSLARIYLCRGEYEKARGLLNRLKDCNREMFMKVGVLGEAIINIRQGKFNAALTELDAVISSRTAAKQTNLNLSIIAIARFMKSRIYAEQKRLDQALQELEHSAKIYYLSFPDDGSKYFYYNIHLLAQQGKYSQAQSALDKLQQAIPPSSSPTAEIMYSRGIIEYFKGEYQPSIDLISRTICGDRDFYGYYMLGLAYLQSDQPQEAVKALSKLDWINYRWSYYSGIWEIKMYYYLGVAYQAVGNDSLAIESFSTFLDLWQNADSSIAEVDDARRRLALIENRKSR